MTGGDGQPAAALGALLAMAAQAYFVNPEKNAEIHPRFSREGVLCCRGRYVGGSMRTGIIPGGVAAALTGAAMMVAVSSAPASAFTLSSPSLAEPVFTADIEHVQWGYWHRPWGYWHRPWGWHPWYRPWYWRPYYHPWRRCWWTWHGRFCRWY